MKHPGYGDLELISEWPVPEPDLDLIRQIDARFGHLDLGGRSGKFIEEEYWSRLPALTLEDKVDILERFANKGEQPLLVLENSRWYSLAELPTLVHKLHAHDFFLIEKVIGRIPVAVAGRLI
jgi:hypothetical protein